MKQYRDVVGKVKIRDGLVSDHLAPEVLGGDVEHAPNHVNADPRGRPPSSVHWKPRGFSWLLNTGTATTHFSN
jgi:hypothetical protein